jgi:hypothetical protein
MIPRYYTDSIDQRLRPNRVLVIHGPRRVGKTTLIQNYIDSLPPQTNLLHTTGESIEIREILESRSLRTIQSYFADVDLFVIDEAQYVHNIGLGLKILVDHLPGVRVIATGSSSFDLSNELGEPLVGRQHVLKLYPLAVLELQKEFGSFAIRQKLEELLIFGGYPEIITSESRSERIEYLQQIRDAYLFKDILRLQELRNAQKLHKLLQLLAFQVGQEVSLQELGNALDMSKNTVDRYLDLLEKTYIIKRVGGFSRNLRKEVNKMSRYYFFDNGILNAVINNFNALDARDDVGVLWENFLFMERLKKQEYHRLYANNYFWRTWTQQEIDLVEERGGKLHGYEFKWSTKKTPAAPSAWREAYDNSTYQVINPDNYLDFVT